MTSENHTPKGGANAQGRVRQRMGGHTPLPQQDTTSGPTRTAADTPVRKTRMGGQSQPVTTRLSPDLAQAHAPVAKTRLGASPVSNPTIDSAPTETASSTASTKAKTRMGGASRATGTGTGQGMEAPTAAASAPNRTAQPGPAVTPGKGQPAWVRPVVIIALLVTLGLVLVVGARWLRTLEVVQEFITVYDGHATQPESAPVGIPGWLGWQHFLNMFFIVLIIRTGLAVRNERKPAAYWTAKKNSFFSPSGDTPTKVPLSQWLHQGLDVLWVANGLLFVVLLFATGHWVRIVPMSWDIFPNMLSASIQYASLDWPPENGWVHYNALQVMAYFITVFIAAPLAVISGIRFSTWWPQKAERLTKVYPVEWARAIHFPVMLYFVAFTVVHVFLVFFTGALVNLNHMYTSRDVVDWWGLVIFLTSLVVIATAWFLTRPLFITPLARKTGTVTRN